MQSMRAAVVNSVPGVPTIQDVEISDPGLGEVLIRTVATGVCHSDLHALHGTGMSIPTPFVVGHEPAGIVEAVGPGVRHLQAGDHVVACLSAFCGHCERCVTGRTYQCFTDEWARQPGEAARIERDGEAVTQFAGLGSYAEWMLVGQNNVVKVRDDMPLDRACLLGCGVLTGVGAVVNTARVPVGSKVVVIGCGGVGLSVIQGARLACAGAIIAVDLNDTKLQLASEMGATATVNASVDDPVAKVVEMTGGGGDFVFEAIGNEKAAREGLAMTGMRGTLTVVGILDHAATITISGADLMMSKRVQQSMMGSNRFVADIPILVDHYMAGRLDLDRMVGATKTLDDVPQALADLDAGTVYGRTVITF